VQSGASCTSIALCGACVPASAKKRRRAGREPWGRSTASGVTRRYTPALLARPALRGL
jgi:hypothetical protein